LLPQFHQFSRGFWYTLILCVAAGCGQSESIRSYVPPEVERGSYDLDRMLGAIIPIGETTWFFKLQGKDEAVHNQKDAFQKFIQTVRAPKSTTEGEKNKAEKKSGLEEPTPPTWTIPKDWIENKPSNQMIHRTFLIPVPKSRPLKLDVSSLPTPERGFDNRYLTDNISRWCRQYGNETIKERDIPDHSIELDLKDLQAGGGKAWIVNISGIFSGGAAMMLAQDDASDPHAGVEMPAKNAEPPAALPSAGGGPGEIKVQIPEGWTAGKPSTFIRREISLAAADGSMIADIYITKLPAAVNDLPSNIARWRGQVKLPDSATADKEAREITVDGSAGHFVELVGPEETILGAMVKKGEDAWFFKFHAPNQLAARDKTKFEEFVKSAKLP